MDIPTQFIRKLGKYEPIEPLHHPVVGLVAQIHKVEPSQVLLRFLIQQEGVVAIPRSSNAERMKLNAQV